MNVDLIPQSIAVQLEEGAREATVTIDPQGRMSVESGV